MTRVPRSFVEQVLISCGTTVVPAGISFTDTNPSENVYDGANNWPVPTRPPSSGGVGEFARTIVDGVTRLVPIT